MILLHDSTGFARDSNAGDPGFDEMRRAFWAQHHGSLEQLFRSAYDIRAVRRPFVVLTPAVED